MYIGRKRKKQQQKTLRQTHAGYSCMISSTIRLFCSRRTCLQGNQVKGRPKSPTTRPGQEWECDWQMQLNTDKCDVIRITDSRNLLYTHDCQTVKNENDSKKCIYLPSSPAFLREKEGDRSLVPLTLIYTG